MAAAVLPAGGTVGNAPCARVTVARKKKNSNGRGECPQPLLTSIIIIITAITNEQAFFVSHPRTLRCNV